MDAVYVKPEDVVKLNGDEATCSECMKDAVQDRGRKKWVIYKRDIVYCPNCAKKEGWAFERF